MTLLIATLSMLKLVTADLYVSPRGDDAGSGSRAHPVRTLERVRDLARRLRKDRPGAMQLVIHLGRGTFELSQAFQLTPEDSAPEGSITTYQGDHTVLSGGSVIRGFQVDSHGWWKVTLPEVRDGKWRFSQLFVNGHRRYRPRLPKTGFYNIAAELPPSAAAKGHGFDRFAFRRGDIDGGWHNLSDVELLCFHIWDMSRMRIGAIEGSTVTTAAPTGYDAGWANFPKGNRYLVENVREALSDPGEWYLDTQSGELTYIPMPGEKVSHTTVVAPRIERILDIEGDVAGHRYVKNVDFKGISFENTNWNLPRQGRFFPQAEVDLSAAIHAQGWNHGSLTDCSVEHVGEYGLELSGGCQFLVAENCRFTDLGAGGIKVGETQQYPNEADTAQHITVSNCLIAHGGRLHPAAIGVWIGQASHNQIQHNQISDLYYTGVSVGWTWGYSKSEAHDNIVRYNDIHDIGQALLSDMGGIYTLGVQPGTTIEGNRIHDVDSFSYGGWGIYPDEGSSNELIVGNTVFRTKSGGYHQHYGENNVVRNNIFAFAREAEIIRTRAEDHLSFTFERNIVYWKDAPLLGSNWSGNNYKLDNNVYWRTDGKPIDFAGMSLDQWRAKGQDVHSAIADPMFVDPPSGDFRLRPNSPALSLGFVPSTVQAGPRHPFKDEPVARWFP